MVAQAQVVTVYGEAFLDSMRYLQFLLKQEKLHTTNFAKKLAILPGNQTLPRLLEAQNATYTSEISMQEMVGAIGESLEESLLQCDRESPFFQLSWLSS